MFLVEQLESLLATGKKLPLTSNVVVDQERALNLIDELRAAVPEEVRAAKRISAEGERIIEKAQQEAERIIAKAQEQAAFLIEERELTRAAELKSKEIVAQGQREADDIRTGADEYALQILATLEAEVTKALAGIQKGMAVLDDRRADLADAEAEEAEASDVDEDEDDEPMDDEGEDEDARHPAYR